MGLTTKDNEMNTVRDLIRELEKFKDTTPVVFRRTYEDGYFCDYELCGPNDFYPHGAAYFMIGSPLKEQDEPIKNDKL